MNISFLLVQSGNFSSEVRRKEKKGDNEVKFEWVK